MRGSWWVIKSRDVFYKWGNVSEHRWALNDDSGSGLYLWLLHVPHVPERVSSWRLTRDSKFLTVVRCPRPFPDHWGGHQHRLGVLQERAAQGNQPQTNISCCSAPLESFSWHGSHIIWVHPATGWLAGPDWQLTSERCGWASPKSKSATQLDSRSHNRVANYSGRPVNRLVGTRQRPSETGRTWCARWPVRPSCLE